MSEKLYKTLFSVEVLSDRDPSDLELSDLHYMITDGDASGRVRVAKQEILTPRQMALALQAQNSDPSFLLGEEEGWKYALHPGDNVTIDTKDGLNGNGYYGAVQISEIEYQETAGETALVRLRDQYGNWFHLRMSEIS